MQKCGYYPIQWSIDSLDWKDYGADDIVRRVVESDKLNNGAIILMHNGAKYTADALDAVITGLKEKGYEIVPIIVCLLVFLLFPDAVLEYLKLMYSIQFHNLNCRNDERQYPSFS